ncbi:hypothetical protein [Pseudoxanthomonas sp. CF125]|uniref:hypothetical protein n=1 Tax=Pseudoxanthomonas sp. CF125 TaxID=1855303 RepID=UPI000888FCFB|nr:hypothetical protein [Pseudoxanthomonas sp. CF125]SDQ24384.1 hypothetical protein SAMN05216569_0263 [Pseudoxanthomonas sp. CF125]
MKIKPLKLALLENSLKQSVQTPRDTSSAPAAPNDVDSDVELFLIHCNAGHIKDCELMSSDEKATALSIAACLQPDGAGQHSVTVLDFVRAINAKLATYLGMSGEDELLPVTATY